MTDNGSQQADDPDVDPGEIDAPAHHVSWLKGQLPELVDRGVLREGQAESIRTLYHTSDDDRWSGMLLTTMGVFGSFLVGAGILLLVAHNWSSFPRIIRLVFSFVPVGTGAWLCYWTLNQRPDSTAWRESSSVFLACAIAACLALIGQIYNLSSGLDRYLLTVSLLTLPLVYLMKAQLPAMLYQCGLLFWFVLVTEEGGLNTLWIWPLYGAVVPWLYRTFGRRIDTGLKVTQLGVTGIVCGIITYCIMDLAFRGLWGYYPLVMSALYVYAGARWLQTSRTYRQPLSSLGYFGLLCTSFWLTSYSSTLWEQLPSLGLHELAGIAGLQGLLVGLGLAGTYLYVLYQCFDRPEHAELQTVVSAPVLLVVAQLLLAVTGSAVLPFYLFNAYVLLLGWSMINRGYVEQNVRYATLGSAVIALLLVIRFFDIAIPFLVRGIGFVIVGTLFLYVTWKLSRDIDSASAQER